MAKHEAKQLAVEWVHRLETLAWEKVERFVETPHVEEVLSGSGTTYRLKAFAFWDAEPRRSSLIIGVHVFPPRGWRRRFGYRAYGSKGEDDVPD